MGIDRRGFIKFIAGGAVGSLVTPIPWKLTNDLSVWSQSWPWIPSNLKGQTKYVKTVSKLCPSGCGIQIKTVGGMPIRPIGDPDHPLSGGKISALAAAEVQLLYSPARLKRPLRRTSDGAYVALTWAEAEALLAEKLTAVKGKADKFACLCGDQTGSMAEVLSAFTAALGSKAFYMEPTEMRSSSKAWNEVMGGEGQIGYALEKSDFVLALGADILESWGTVVRNRRAYSALRPHAEAPKAKFVYAGPVQTNTAVGSDKWLPVKPGAEAALALGLLNLLVKAGAVSPQASEVADFEGLKTLAATFTPERVQKETGLAPQALADLAKDLQKAKSPIVIAGSEFGQGAGASVAMAGIALNLALGNVNKQGGMAILPEAATVVQGAMDRKTAFKKDFVAWMQAIAAKKAEAPDVMLVYEANPVYSLANSGIPETFAKLPFKVAVTSFLDETALSSDLVLPTPMGLERYDDIYTPFGSGQVIYSVGKPVIKPLVDAKPAGDLILALSKKLGADLGFTSFKDVLKAKAEKLGAAFADLEAGKAFVSDATKTLAGASYKPAALTEALKPKPVDSAFPLSLAVTNKLNFGSALSAIAPFQLKTIRDTDLLGADSFVQMNSATAGKLGLKEGDVIMLSSKSGGIKALVHLSEGVMTDVVAAPLGFGHTGFDEYSKGKGVNVAKLFTPVVEPGTGLAAWTDAMVKIAKI